MTYLQSGKQKEALNALDEAARVTEIAPEFSVGLAELYANFGSQVPDQKTASFANALAILQLVTLVVAKVALAEEDAALVARALAGLELLMQHDGR